MDEDAYEDVYAEGHQFLVDEIRRRAERRGLSVEGLATEAGMARSHLQKIFAGTVEPKFGTILRLAAALRCRPCKLLP